MVPFFRAVACRLYDRGMRIAACVALVFACSTTSAFPYTPGGGGGGHGGGGGGGGGGGPDSGPGSDLITAQACSLDDLRLWTMCAASGAGGLLVTLGDGSATTADDGSFTIPTQSGTNLLWTISGSGFLTTLMPFDAAITQIPVVSENTFEPIVADNAVTDTTDGQVFISINSFGEQIPNEVARSTPLDNQTFYDDATDDFWGQIETSTHGIAWLSGIVPGVATVEVQPASDVGSGSGSGVGTATGVPVGSGALTFIELSVPAS
jgi:hypothetical protein